jgi:hypothetical protein
MYYNNIYSTTYRWIISEKGTNKNSRKKKLQSLSASFAKTELFWHSPGPVIMKFHSITNQVQNAVQ